MGVKLWVNRGHIYLSLCYGGKQWRKSTGLTVPGTKALQKEVMKLAGDTDPPFPYLAGLKCAVCTNRLLHVWGVAAGIEKPVTWHIARHTAATLLLEAGADVYTVQHILGHTSVSTTQIYAEVSGGRKRKALDALAGLLKNPQKS